MNTDTRTQYPSARQGQQPTSKRGSFFLIMSTVAGVLTFLLVGALYYFNTTTHITP